MDLLIGHIAEFVLKHLLFEYEGNGKYLTPPVSGYF
jgi:hypothetical protein